MVIGVERKYQGRLPSVVDFEDKIGFADSGLVVDASDASRLGYDEFSSERANRGAARLSCWPKRKDLPHSSDLRLFLRVTSTRTNTCIWIARTQASSYFMYLGATTPLIVRDSLRSRFHRRRRLDVFRALLAFASILVSPNWRRRRFDRRGCAWVWHRADPRRTGYLRNHCRKHRRIRHHESNGGFRPRCPFGGSRAIAYLRDRRRNFRVACCRAVLGAPSPMVSWMSVPFWMYFAVIAALGLLCILASLIAARPAMRAEPARVFRA